LLAAGPSSIGLDNQNVFAKKIVKSNKSTQGIDQSTTTEQAAVCNALGDTLISCNNVALSFNLNDGNNTAGQQ
jgi:hypothetical protein